MFKKLPSIPYMGSKRAISSKLLDIMLEIKPKAKYFYDLFGGGGSMSFTALNRGLITHYNEYYKPMYLLMDFLVQRAVNKETGSLGFLPDDWYKFVSKEDFVKIKTENSAYSQFVRLVYSFGNIETNYLYNKETEEFKKNYHNLAVYKCEKSAKYLSNFLGIEIKPTNLPTIQQRRLKIRQTIHKGYKDAFLTKKEWQHPHRLQNLERFSGFETLKQLQNLERFEGFESVQSLDKLRGLDRFTISNLDYMDVKIETPIEETIIYCDPPYRNTKGYRIDFDVGRFDEWFNSLEPLAFLSEYASPHFLIGSIEKRALLSGAHGGIKIEYVYTNKDIKVAKQQDLFAF